MEEKSYFEGLACGIKSLCTGLKTTMREFFTPKITEQYPENRKELQMFERFRGSLTMPHNEKNEHHIKYHAAEYAYQRVAFPYMQYGYKHNG